MENVSSCISVHFRIYELNFVGILLFMLLIKPDADLGRPKNSIQLGFTNKKHQKHTFSPTSLREAAHFANSIRRLHCDCNTFYTFIVAQTVVRSWLKL